MEFTGERYLPILDTADISYEHWHRYLYASQFVKGKIIVDIGCGEGYGSFLLAQNAQRVFAIDNNYDTIKLAANKYTADNLEFKVGSLSSIPIEGESILDGIISFESIEHIDEKEQEAFLGEVKRLLKPEGFLLISTPNKMVYSDKTGYKNKFHQREFYTQEFHAFLQKYFTHIKLLGQKVYPVSYIWDPHDARGNLAEYRLMKTELGFRPTDEPKSSRYIVAWCSDAELPSVSASLLVDLSESSFKDRDDQISTLQDQLKEKDNQARVYSTNLKEREQQVQAATIKREEKAREAEAFSRQIIEIKSSTAWKLIQGMWQARLHLAPRGSRRERFVRLAIRSLVVLKNEGGRAFIRATLRKIALHSNINLPARTYSFTPETDTISAIKQIEDSGLFDNQWYIEQYPDVKDFGMTPLMHYLKIGASQGYNPNPLINTSIYSKAHGISPENTLAHFYDSRVSLSPGAYKDPDVLFSIQRLYKMNTDTECLNDRRSGQRRFAVFLQCGSGSVHTRWFRDEPRPWDFIVNHYDDTYVGKISCDAEFRQVGLLPGTKFTFFYTLLTKWPQFVSNYEYVLLLDDDIVLDETDITKLFTISQSHTLDLAQASLSSDSYGAHPVFRCSGSRGLRYVNAVEIMMPILSQRAIRIGTHLFNQTISGWGLDVALGSLVKEQANGRAAVIDDIVATHKRPIDVEKGAFYTMLHDSLIYPEIELTHLQKLYDVHTTFFELDND